MAVFYNKEKARHGSMVGTIISFPVEITSEDPKASINLAKLPAGYIRCDGRILFAEQYPALAEVLGTGDECRFKKPDQALSTNQFQLPDLRNKHIRSTSSSNIGLYNDLIVQDINGNDVVKSGVGLDVIQNIESPYELTYTGDFFIPIQTVDLRGEPSFTIDTGSYTYETDVAQNMFQPHLHRTNTLRSRQKNRNGNFFSSRQVNSVRSRSSLNVCQWWENTKQELCYWQMTTAVVPPPPGVNPLASSDEIQYGACWFACSGFTTSGYCLWPDSGACPEVNNQDWGHANGQTIGLVLQESCNHLSEDNPVTFGNITYDPTYTQNCVCTAPILGACPGGTNGNTGFSDFNSDDLTNYAQSNGSINLPFTSVDVEYYRIGSGAVQNITTLSGEFGNEGTHRHRLNFNADEPHTYQMKTRAASARADSGLVSRITIDINTSKKSDKYIQPYVVTEYLIKI